MLSRTSATLGVAAAAVLALPAVAAAATATVSMGPPPPDGQVFQQKYGSDVNAFFPTKLQIHVGDSVRFVPNGFHNVEFPAARAKPVPLITPNGTAAGIVDAAGAPFWFNGQPTVGFNPVLLASSFGKTVTFDRTKGLNSGLPLEDKPKPITVKFTRKGSFSYLCTVHHGMKGQIQVKSAKARIPSARGVRRSVSRQLAKARKDAASLSRTRAPKDTVLVGAAKGGADFFGFLPANLTVTSGTTVEFRMPPGSREAHSATFGPGVPDDPEKQPTGYVGEIAKTFESPAFDARGVYPSDPPNTVAPFGPTLHGNGFWNSGLVDRDPSSPLGTSAKVTFGAPGTFRYLCVLHPFMQGTITVK